MLVDKTNQSDSGMENLYWILIAILFSAFFSGMEMAFVSSNKLRLEITKKQQNLSSRILTWFTENPSQYISTMIAGNMLALVVYGMLVAGILAPPFNLLAGENFAISLLARILVAAIVIIISAEIIPRLAFRAFSNASLRFFAVPLAFFYILFYPFVRISLWISTGLGSFSGINMKDAERAQVLSKIDPKDYYKDSDEAGQQESGIDNELRLFQNALDFSDIRVRECMVPRTEIVAVEENAGIDELTQEFINSGYSKIFVYKDNIDQIIGYVSAHDLFTLPESVPEMIKKALIIPETMTAQDLLTLFISRSKGIAVVVDEFGGTAGIVSIEDILEEIFGEIEDEYDTIELIEKELPDGSYVFSGRTEIDYLNEKYELGLKESDEYETLAGYILFLHGSFPGQGEIISDSDNEDMTFQILRAGDTRIELVKIMSGQ
ncbi:MAG: hemolysin family protein [Bacteroidota bacterium]